MKPKSIAVFCGSQTGNNEAFSKYTIALSAYFIQHNITLIYGGGNIGLMGIAADEILRNNGKVIGVIPYFLMELEVGHSGLTELIKVDTMHQRKQIMCDRSDAFIILPGGFGTLDEFFEILTWKQLKLHNKPIGILNIDGYYDNLLQHINHMISSAFVSEKNSELFISSSNVEELIAKLI